MKHCHNSKNRLDQLLFGIKKKKKKKKKKPVSNSPNLATTEGISDSITPEFVVPDDV
jgi:hypothetical protein